MQALYKQFQTNIIKTALVVAAFLCGGIVQAQVMVVDATNRPIMPKEYVNLKGSPYLYDDWVEGTVRLANGVEYKNIYLMYDQVKDELNFTYKDEKVQKFVDPVARFTLGDRVFRRDLAGGRKPFEKEFYEVLADGNIKLLKRTNKKVVEEVNHAVATKDKRILTAISYYLMIDGDLIKIRNNKNAVIKALGTHKAPLEAYIKKEDLDLRDEQDMAKLITYHNSLK